MIDATIDLFQEGHLPPAADDIAARAGVSTATLFRYYPTLDDMRAETITRFSERHNALWDLDHVGAGPLDERIERLVAARLTLYETVAPVARFARARAHEQPQIAATLDLRRGMLTRQIEAHFALELEGLAPADRAGIVGAIAVITSFEAWDMWSALNLTHGDHDVTGAWTTALTALLS